MQETDRERMFPGVLMIAPGRKVRGGITTVVATLEESEFWRDHKCFWLETLDDRNPLRKLLAGLSAFFKFPFVVRNRDIVHIHVSLGVSIIRKSVFFHLSKLLGKRTVVQIHCDFQKFFAYGGLLGGLARRMLRNADAVVALTSGWAAGMPGEVPPDRIHIIGNPVKCGRCVTTLRSDEAPTVSYMGLIKREKGVHDLVEAMARVVEQLPEAKLELAGDGDVNEVRQKVQSLGISDSVVFRSWLDEDGKKDMLERTTVFCLPSHAEGLPMVLLESMSQAVPVVTCPVGGIPDIVSSEETGLLVPVGNISKLAEALTRLLKNPELRTRLGQSGRELVRNKYSVEHISEQFSELYRDLDRGDI